MEKRENVIMSESMEQGFTSDMLRKMKNLGIARRYNVFVFENHEQSFTEAEGRVAVGGDAIYDEYCIGSWYEYSNKLPKPGMRNDLIVGGFADIRGGINYSGNTVMSCLGKVRNYSMTNKNVLSCMPINERPIEFQLTRTYLEQASRYWASLPANGSCHVNGRSLQLIGSDHHLNIFYIEGTFIDDSGLKICDLDTIEIDAPAYSTVLINISGLDVYINCSKIHTNNVNVHRILWNFYEARDWFNVSTGIEGTVLAPFACMDSFGGFVKGSIITKSLKGKIAAFHCPFRGKLPKVDFEGLDCSRKLRCFVSRQKAVSDYFNAACNIECAIKQINLALKEAYLGYEKNFHKDDLGKLKCSCRDVYISTENFLIILESISDLIKEIEKK